MLWGDQEQVENLQIIGLVKDSYPKARFTY